ncbi:porin [Delftia tsuruhatensis]|uniref:porin n=1 Tax=Delftia tsuruhatensis TaxID=180282 RepID=UPI001F27E35E|nr:porin [Delftia tsuruhatensis]
MKIHHILAAATLPIISIGASAQSSVTLFGILDTNIRYVNNSDLPSNITMDNGACPPAAWASGASRIWAAGSRRDSGWSRMSTPTQARPMQAASSSSAAPRSA